MSHRNHEELAPEYVHGENKYLNDHWYVASFHRSKEQPNAFKDAVKINTDNLDAHQVLAITACFLVLIEQVDQNKLGIKQE